MAIIGKVWNVGSSGGSKKNIASSIDYITNEEKCDYTIDKTLNNEVAYISNDIRTVKGAYIAYKYILDEDAVSNEMMAIKAFYGKENGRSALHGIISLEKYESDIKNAGNLMRLCSEFLDNIFPNHQAIYAIHTNTDHMHVHFVINTVGLDGKKLHMDKTFMKKIFQPSLNALAIKYGFEPNEEWNKPDIELSSVKARKIYLRNMIDRGIEKSDNFTQLIRYLRKQGLTVNVGKHISIKAKGMKKAFRTYQLGSDYTTEAIKQRILEKKEPFDVFDAAKISVSKEDATISTYIAQSMKRYKELDRSEQIKVVKLLKLGRNPWKERSKSNWLITKLDNELNDKANAISLIKYYAPRTYNVNAAMREIITRQESIGEEIKELNAIKRKHRVEFKILGQLKQVEKAAYLYESTRDVKYFEDYTKYIVLKDRLKNYDKTPKQLDEYKAELEGNILYLKAQRDILKEQYRILYFQVNPKETERLFNAIGHSKAREDAYYKGVFITCEKYISDKDSEYILRVVQRPGTKDGKNTIISDITVMDKDEKVIEVISSKSMTERLFNKEIYRIEKNYGLKNCVVSSTRAQIQSKN